MDHDPGPGGHVRRALHLRTFPAFSGLAAEALAVLARPCVPMSFEPGEVLLEPGGRPVLHFILEGQVDVLEGDAVLRSMHAREAVGGLAVLDPAAEGARVRARTSTRTLALGRAELEAVFEDHPEIRVAVTRAVARTLANVLAPSGRSPHLSSAEDGLIGHPHGGHRSPDLVENTRAILAAFGFCGVTVAAAIDLAREGRVETVAAAAPVWHRGEVAVDVTVVLSGALVAGEGEAEVEHRPGELVGLLEALAERERWFELRAEEASHLLRLPTDALLDVADEHRELAVGLVAALARAAAQAFRRPA